MLKMVQEGKLTVEEAFTMFERLDEQKSNIGLLDRLHMSEFHSNEKQHSAKMDLLKFLDTTVMRGFESGLCSLQM
ncbi:hypothetical protein [Parageobacillus thermantarcticus]